MILSLNKLVLEDLVSQSTIANKNYQIIHHEGPDARGIDCALLYDPLHFKVTSSKSVKFTIPGNDRFRSRDQLVVSGELLGEKIHIIVIHWPSRRGGESKSRPKRIAAAKLSKSIVDSLQQINKKAKVIVMGDFNVAPTELDIGIGEQNAKRWLRDGKTAFLPEEIEMWNRIKDLGFVDSWRKQNPEEGSIYSWFDYRSRMFDDNPKRGLRIDHILLSENIEHAILDTGIDYSARAMEKPSDHCPIWLELK